MEAQDSTIEPPEPIAVVGMAFEFPGGATTEDSLWTLLMQKRCVSSEFPRSRMNIDAFYHPSRPGAVSGTSDFCP
jgi:acyl transferase domain-containing protein